VVYEALGFGRRDKRKDSRFGKEIMEDFLLGNKTLIGLMEQMKLI
jgi:hypothetical protein